MAARRLGDASAALPDSPSDGKERNVADGVFAYSTAPVTAAVRFDQIAPTPAGRAGRIRRGAHGRR